MYKRHSIHWAIIAVTIFWMFGVVFAALFYLPPALNFAVPKDAKIIVFHVPCAIISVMAYIISTAYAIAYLLNRKIYNDMKSSLSALLGLIFTVSATLSGIIFAKIQWGSAWNWDPREISILILMFVYLAYFALRNAITIPTAKAKISAAYNIIACSLMPYLVFVFPRILPGLHPNNTLIGRGGLSLQYRTILAASTIGFILIYFCLSNFMLIRLEKQKNELNKQLKALYE